MRSALLFAAATWMISSQVQAASPPSAVQTIDKPGMFEVDYRLTTGAGDVVTKTSTLVVGAEPGLFRVIDSRGYRGAERNIPVLALSSLFGPVTAVQGPVRTGGAGYGLMATGFTTLSEVSRGPDGALVLDAEVDYSVPDAVEADSGVPSVMAWHAHRRMRLVPGLAVSMPLRPVPGGVKAHGDPYMVIVSVRPMDPARSRT